MISCFQCSETKVSIPLRVRADLSLTVFSSAHSLFLFLVFVLQVLVSKKETLFKFFLTCITAMCPGQ